MFLVKNLFLAYLFDYISFCFLYAMFSVLQHVSLYGIETEK